MSLSANATEFIPRQRSTAAAASTTTPAAAPTRVSANAAPFTPASISAAAAAATSAAAPASSPLGRNNRRRNGPTAEGAENSADAPAASRNSRGGGRNRNGDGDADTPANPNPSRGRNNGGRRNANDGAAAADGSSEHPPRGGGGRGPRRGNTTADDGEGASPADARRGGRHSANNRSDANASAHANNNASRRRGGDREGNASGGGRDSNNNNRRRKAEPLTEHERECEHADATPFVTAEQAEGTVRAVDGTPATRQICTELLTGEYECVLCLVPIRSQVATWGCGSCFHVFHLSCVKHWAKQPESGTGRTFRCPHCQAPDNVANAYYCFCTKQRDPKYDPNLVPHTCGESCGKKRGKNCNHPCPSICHPGPCPPCPRFHTATCPCGATQYDYGCDKLDPMLTCGGTCGKLLPCGNHTCERPCHTGSCGGCDRSQDVKCICGKETRALPCGAEPFNCANVCDKTQRCGHHKCPVTCHSGNCPPCDYDPASVSTCPCGKEELTAVRTSCADPIPTCGQLCGKALLCGNHICEEVCHDGPCKPCSIKILAKCRCGQVQAKVLCNEREAFRCEKKCKGGLKCGKHECPTLCCAFRGKLHPNNNECPRICGKQLLCGHTCGDRCHPNLCQPCPNVVTSVLQCRCGNQQLIPPLPCGTQPPRCFLPCTLPRPCGHPQTKHDCHYEDCPPCMHLVKKRCDGGHKDVEVFCHTTAVCCGAKCGRPLKCGHACDRLCHDGPCAAEDEVCRRPCGKEIDECGHFCSTPCHSSKPNVVCRCATKVSMACECGRRTEEIGCGKYQKLLAARLEAKAEAVAKREEERKAKAEAAAATAANGDREGDNNGEEGETPSASASASAAAVSSAPITDAEEDAFFDRPITIDCNADCAYQNRLSALAARSAPKIEAQHKATIFSLRLWEIAGQALDVVGRIETKLNDFVRNASEVSLMLPPMPKERRMIVHELANFYHLKCESVDNEPNRTCYLTKTMTARVPTPQLTAARINAVYHEKCDPAAIIVKVITSPTLAPAQTLVFSGDKNLNEIAINGYLKEIIGSFVAVQSEDAYGMCPNIGSQRMHETLFDAMDEHTFFAVFATKFDADAGFAILRRGGCPVLYRRVGEAPPPAKHVWEPRRDPETGAVVPGEGEYVAAPAKPAKSWGEMFAQPRLNAKQRKELENSKVETSGGAFASLRKK